MDKIRAPICPPVMHSLDISYGQLRIPVCEFKLLIRKENIDLRIKSGVPYKHSNQDI